MDGWRQASPGCRRANRIDGVSERHARLQVEGDGNRREKTLMAYGERRGGRSVMGKSAQRNRFASRRTDVDLAQELRILPEFRRGLHNHVILIQRAVHGRDLALAESVVKSVVNQLG